MQQQADQPDEDDPEPDRSDRPPKASLPLLLERELADGERDDEGIVARQGQIEDHDLDPSEPELGGRQLRPIHWTRPRRASSRARTITATSMASAPRSYKRGRPASISQFGADAFVLSFRTAVDDVTTERRETPLKRAWPRTTGAEPRAAAEGSGEAAGTGRGPRR